MSNEQILKISAWYKVVQKSSDIMRSEPSEPPLQSQVNDPTRQWKKVKRQINYLQHASICGAILYGRLLFGRWTTIHYLAPIVLDDVISI